MSQYVLNSTARWLALAVLLVGQLMIVLDVSVINIALPTIQAELHFSQSALAWIVNAYLITFGGFLLFSGRLGDIVGHKKIFIAGMTVFTAASWLCGVSTSGAFLIAARFVQGFGAALVSAVVLGIVFKLFTAHDEQARAMGYWGLVGAAGASIGLVVGGVLTQLVSWHWIFYINIPFGLVALCAGWYLIPDDSGQGFGKGLDVPGALLLVSALVLLNYGIIQAADIGWLALQTLAEFATVLVLLAVFVWLEGRLSYPLVSLRIFRVHNLAAANLTQFFVSWAIFSPFFLTALYLQEVYKLDPISAGLAFLPQTVVFGVTGVVFAPYIMRRFGSRTAVLCGLPIFTLSLALFAFLPVHPDYWLNILPPMLLMGLGGTLSSLPLAQLAMSQVETHDSGLASGLINTSRQTGGAFGVALVGSITAAWTSGLLVRGTDSATALTAGYHVGFWLDAGAAAFAFFVATRLVAGRPNASFTPEENAASILEAGEMM